MEHLVVVIRNKNWKIEQRTKNLYVYVEKFFSFFDIYKLARNDAFSCKNKITRSFKRDVRML